MGDQVRQQQVPIIGEGQGVYSFVHIDDAAGATLRWNARWSIQHRRRKPVASALVADGLRACCRSTCATSRQRRTGARPPCKVVCRAGLASLAYAMHRPNGRFNTNGLG